MLRSSANGLKSTGSDQYFCGPGPGHTKKATRAAKENATITTSTFIAVSIKLAYCQFNADP